MSEITQDRASGTRDTFLPFARPSITDDDVAAVGEVLKSGWFDRRGELTERYRRKLADVKEVLPLSDPDYDHDHARHLFIVRLESARAALDRDTFMEELGKRNIGTGLHLRAVHLQQYYMEHMGTKRGILPETDESDVDDVVGAIRDVLGGGR